MMNSVQRRVLAAKIMCQMEDAYRNGNSSISKTEDGTYIYEDNIIEAKMTMKES